MTATAIPQVNQTFSKPQVLGWVSNGVLVKTDDYNIDAVLDLYKLMVLGPLASANKTFTLPDLSSGVDGAIIRFENDSYYELILGCGSSDSVWNSGNGYGITLVGKGTGVTLLADYTNLKWRVLDRKGAGKIMIEGLKLHEPMNKITLDYISTSPPSFGRVLDLTNRHNGKILNGLRCLSETVSKFPPGCLVLMV